MMREIMHMVLKYNDNVHNVDTMKKHKDLLEKEDKVVWGVIKPTINSPGIGVGSLNKIKSQIEENINMYAYFATGGEIKAKGRIINILTNDEVHQNEELVPEYYHKDIDKCVAGILLESIEFIEPNIIDKLQRYNNENKKIALHTTTNPLYVSHIDEIMDNRNTKEENIPIDQVNLVYKEKKVEDVLKQITTYIKSKGFVFSYEDICNFYLSLKTKPFVILAGISGTGKSKLVKLFAEAINANNSNGRYTIISVKPDWNDSTDLFGYKNINDSFVPGILTSIILEASKLENRNKPYFICLDEMNLARVEYYLSEYLSIIESRLYDTKNDIITDKIYPIGYLPVNDKYSRLYIPDNIYIIGTVNMDDTTFSFSRKVLDRTNTIEFSEVRLEDLDFDDESSEPINMDNSIFKTKFLSIKDALRINKDYVIGINSKIIEINNILSISNKHFGYRVRDEIVFYMLENKIGNILDEDIAFDYQILQKILPTITGSDFYIKEILVELYNLCNPEGQITSGMDYINDGISNLDTAIYINSAKKILTMLRGYEDGFVSFWQ